MTGVSGDSMMKKVWLLAADTLVRTLYDLYLSLSDFSMRNACNNDDKDNGEAYCHFYWASKTWSGGYAYMTTSTKDCSFIKYS